MSLLTKEQQTIVENIRQAEANAFYNPDPGCGNQFMNARVAAIELLSIIDDLQARAPKQYTEQELRSELYKQYPDIFGRQRVKEMRESVWMACAKFVGALKAEP